MITKFNSSLSRFFLKTSIFLFLGVLMFGNSIILVSNSSIAYATTQCSGSTGVNSDGKICNPISATSIDGLLTSILTIVKFVAGIVLVIYFILAGFRYVTARGDETKIKSATTMLTWTAVGGAILLGAEVIQKLLSSTISQLGTGL